MRRSMFTLVGALAASILFGSCADNSSSVDQQVEGQMSEWAITLDDDTATAGPLTFRISNDGTIDHEFLILKTNIPNGEIPVEGGIFEEDLASIEVIDEIPPFSAGSTAEITVDLQRGLYQLVCNLPGHYEAGMHTTLNVE